MRVFLTKSYGAVVILARRKGQLCLQVPTAYGPTTAVSGTVQVGCGYGTGYCTPSPEI